MALRHCLDDGGLGWFVGEGDDAYNAVEFLTKDYLLTFIVLPTDYIMGRVDSPSTSLVRPVDMSEQRLMQCCRLIAKKEETVGRLRFYSPKRKGKKVAVEATDDNAVGGHTVQRKKRASGFKAAEEIH